MSNPNRIFRSAYGYDLVAASNEATTPTPEGEFSLTCQDMTEDADLNIMMKRFGIGAVMPVNHRVPSYEDFEHITDFRSALDAVAQARDNFMEIPADIRAQFDNDPQQFLMFCADKTNLPQLQKWGMAITPEPGTIPPVPDKPPTGGST